MRTMTTIGVALLLTTTSGVAFAQASRCAGIADPSARLTCYDREAAPSRPEPVAPARRAVEPAWDPATIGKDHVPVPPQDRAFDPRAQNQPVQHIGPVKPAMRQVGSVPIAAFPDSGVPRVTLGVDALRAMPGGRWVVAISVANNSPQLLDARIGCVFHNAGRPVADIEVMMPGIRPGDRVMADIEGPPVTSYVDTVPCQVLSPQR
ncbi:MAG TPA: hypothetical protein VJ890_12660 [Vineibacter sp.]|nr:hypothetical protein [Vineibacter sp.]